MAIAITASYSVKLRRVDNETPTHRCHTVILADKIVSRCLRTLRDEGHSAVVWGIWLVMGASASSDQSCCEKSAK